MAAADITLRVAGAIGEIAPEAWDACANPAEESVIAHSLRGDARAKPQDCGGELLEAPALVSNAAYNPLSRTLFCPPSSGLDRPAAAPAGSPCISSHRPAAARSSG